MRLYRYTNHSHRVIAIVCVYVCVCVYIEGNPVSRIAYIYIYGVRKGTTTKIRDEINQSDQRDSVTAGPGDPIS